MRLAASLGSLVIASMLLASALSSPSSAQSILWQRGALDRSAQGSGLLVDSAGTVYATGSPSWPHWTTALRLDGTPLFTTVDTSGMWNAARASATSGASVVVVGVQVPPCVEFGCVETTWIERWGSGGRQWRVLPGLTLDGITATADELYLNGSVFLNGASPSPFVMRRALADGSLAWVRYAPETGPLRGTVNAIAALPSGGVLVAGFDGASGYVRRYTPTGDVVWTTMLAQGPQAQRLAVDAAGNAWLGVSGLDLRVLQLSSDGSLRSSATVEAQSPGGVALLAGWIALRPKATGGIVAVASVYGAFPEGYRTTSLLASFRDDGHAAWTGVVDDSPVGLTVDRAGNLYLGTSFATPQRTEATLRKFSPRGTPLWTLAVPWFTSAMPALGPADELVMLVSPAQGGLPTGLTPQVLRVDRGPDEALEELVEVPMLHAGWLALLAGVLLASGGCALRATRKRS